jgi:hypothetical protein
MLWGEQATCNCSHRLITMFSTHVGNQPIVTIIGCMFSTHVGNQPIATIIGCMFSTHVGNQPIVTIIGCMFSTHVGNQPINFNTMILDTKQSFGLLMEVMAPIV